MDEKCQRRQAAAEALRQQREKDRAAEREACAERDGRLRSKIRKLCVMNLGPGNAWGDLPSLTLGWYARPAGGPGGGGRHRLDVCLMRLADNGIHEETVCAVKSATTRLRVNTPREIQDWFERAEAVQHAWGKEVAVRSFLRLTGPTDGGLHGEDILALACSAQLVTMKGISEEWTEDEVSELLDAEGGEAAGMDNLHEYRACLSHFAAQAADRVVNDHRAACARAHAAWCVARDAAIEIRQLAPPSPVPMADPRPVRSVEDGTRLVIIRYEAMMNIPRLSDR